MGLSGSLIMLLWNYDLRSLCDWGGVARDGLFVVSSCGGWFVF